LRATIDYWVNAMDGQPFFLINKPIDPGLLRVLREDIIPRLEQDVPDQPTHQEMAENPYMHRFVMIFDREGYSPDFIKEMRVKRIACVTYNKFPGQDWSTEEFALTPVKLISGEVVDMNLAERGVKLNNGLWVREIRKLTEGGHQTSFVSTDYGTDYRPLAGAMFARWSQELFFKYMRNQFNLDRLLTYDLDAVPDTTRVVNPEYKRIDGLIKSTAQTTARKVSEFGSLMLTGEIEPDRTEKYQQRKAALQEEIALLQRIFLFIQRHKNKLSTTKQGT
jgi:hypothetical protein